MKKIRKRLLALGAGLVMLASSAVSMSASAATIVDWNSSSDNYFTPYTGSFLANDGLISVSGLKWKNSQLTSLKNEESKLILAQRLVAEYEFRPQSYNGQSLTDPRLIWKPASDEDHFSNMPDAYYETQDDDPNDYAVCCGSVTSCNTSTSYYGNLYLDPVKTYAPGSVRYIFESELGKRYTDVDKWDAWPMLYAEYKNNTPSNYTYFNSTYSW